jgi:hypothetical protein
MNLTHLVMYHFFTGASPTDAPAVVQPKLLMLMGVGK